MIEKNAFSIIFGIFILFTCRDVFYGQSNHEAEPDHAKPISMNDHMHHQHAPTGPGTTFGDASHTVRIQYCHSCGYRQAFEEISKMLQTHFPDIKIIGDIHQPGWLRSQLVNLLFFTKVAVMGMIYMGFDPFAYFQLETPRIWTYMVTNKVSSSLFILFIGNTIDSNMMSTGAFEIFYDDVPIWSKIQSGRMPSPQELLQAIQGQTSFGKRTVGEFVHA